MREIYNMGASRHVRRLGEEVQGELLGCVGRAHRSEFCVQSVFEAEVLSDDIVTSVLTQYVGKTFASRLVSEVQTSKER